MNGFMLGKTKHPGIGVRSAAVLCLGHLARMTRINNPLTYVDLDGHQQGDKAWLEPAKEYINSLFRSFSKKTDPDPQPAEIRPGPSVDREWISIRPGLGLRRLTG